MTTLREFAETHVGITRELFEKQKTIAPMFVAETGDGTMMIPVTFEDDAEKDVVAAAMRELFKRLQVARYVYISEAWALKLPIDTDVTKVVRPTHNPDRIEVLVVEAEDTTGSVAAHMQIKRDGDAVTLGAPEYFAGPSIGRFCGLLPTTEH